MTRRLPHGSNNVSGDQTSANYPGGPIWTGRGTSWFYTESVVAKSAHLYNIRFYRLITSLVFNIMMSYLNPRYETIKTINSHTSSLRTLITQVKPHFS